MRKKLVIVASTANSLINFRYDLIKFLKKEYDIQALSKDFDPQIKNKLNKIGVFYKSYGYKKASFFSEIISILNLFSILKYKQDFKLISYTLRANIFCGLVSIFYKNLNHYPMITGLGNIFLAKYDSIFNYIFFLFIKICIKITLIKCKIIIFQNISDKKYFNKNIIRKKSALIPGSGVNLKNFRSYKLPKMINFVMVSRIIKNKGIEDYYDVGNYLLKKYKNIQFIFVGKKNDHYSLNNKKLFSNKKNKIVFLKWVKDIRKIFKQTSVYVLLSKREGMSRSILEAMCCGRPIITTNVPGCRETVRNNYNGFKIKFNDKKSLEKVIERFINDPNLIKKFGRNSRKFVQKFDVEIVNSKIKKILTSK